jgi:hypothetical protein
VGLERGSTQPREQFEELLGRNSSDSRSRKSKLRSKGLVALTTCHTLSAEVGTGFADRRRSLDRYSSLADSKPRSFFRGLVLGAGKHRVVVLIVRSGASWVKVAWR